MIDKKLLPEYIAAARKSVNARGYFSTPGARDVYLQWSVRVGKRLLVPVRRLVKLFWEDAPLRMAEFLSEDLIFLDLDAPDKATVFREIVEAMARQGTISSATAFLSELMEREAIEPTCIGRSVAFPHTRTDLVKRPVIAFARPLVPIPFSDSADDNARLIFVMGTPKSENNLYLNILSRLCKMLRQPDFRDALIAAASPREALELIKQKELRDLEQRHTPSLVS